MSECDILSESQVQLKANVQQLKNENDNLMAKYGATNDATERTNILNQIKKNEAMWTSLLASAGTLAHVQTTCVKSKETEAETVTILGDLMDQQLKDAREQIAELETSRAGKERMIELNTYYGKRFMAQAGVMKIFIYMCIPLLILAVLANMGFLPNYIAGFMIIASIVIGIVYMYSAVNDINRRDKTNFDEYTWEFDPSRVGSIVNPNGSGGANSSSNLLGCYSGACCNPPSTIWDPNTKMCVVQTAQGEGSAVKGSSAASTASTAAPTSSSSGFMGDLTSQPTI
jgi:hypothetical protein